MRCVRVFNTLFSTKLVELDPYIAYGLRQWTTFAALDAQPTVAEAADVMPTAASGKGGGTGGTGPIAG